MDVFLEQVLIWHKPFDYTCQYQSTTYMPFPRNACTLNKINEIPPTELKHYTCM